MLLYSTLPVVLNFLHRSLAENNTIVAKYSPILKRIATPATQDFQRRYLKTNSASLLPSLLFNERDDEVSGILRGLPWGEMVEILLHPVIVPHLILSEKLFQKETLTYIAGVSGLQVCHVTLAGKSLKGNIGAWNVLHLDESVTPPTLVQTGHFLGNNVASWQSAWNHLPNCTERWSDPPEKRTTQRPEDEGGTESHWPNKKPCLDYRSCNYRFPVGVSLRNSTKDSLLGDSTKEMWSLKLYIYLKRIRTTDDNYSSHTDWAISLLDHSLPN